MNLSLDRSNPLPIGVQLAEQIRQAILTGELRPGDTLPTIRDAADDAGVNVNTVAAVYRELADEGYLTQGRRAGTQVAEEPPVRPERALAVALAEHAQSRASAAGLSVGDVALALLAVNLRSGAGRTRVRVAAMAGSPLAAAQLAARLETALAPSVEIVPVTPNEYRSEEYHFTMVAPELTADLPGAQRGAAVDIPRSEQTDHDSMYGPNFPAGAD